MSTVQARPIPGPQGLEHLRVMEAAARYINAAVWQLSERHGDIFTFGFGPIKFIWLVGPEANRFVLQERVEAFELRRAYNFLQPIGGDRALIVSDEPEHLRRRRLVQPAFHGARLSETLKVVEGHMQRLVDTVPYPGRFDFYSHAQGVVLECICEVLLGPETLKRLPELVPLVRRMMRFAAQPMPAQLFRLPLPLSPWARFSVARSELDGLLYAEIALRRRAPAETGDILSLLLTARDEAGESLSDREVRDQVVSLVSAGFDTTSAALSWAVYAMLTTPDARARLEAEAARLELTEASMEALKNAPYLDAFVKETLRLYPPAPAGLRQAAEDLNFKGYALPKGSLIAFSIYATHRQSRSYPAPLNFEPERWSRAPGPPDFAYLPFGYGARYCIGAQLATLIIKVGLLKGLESGLQPAWRGEVREHGTTLHPKGGLWLSRKTLPPSVLRA